MIHYFPATLIINAWSLDLVWKLFENPYNRMPPPWLLVLYAVRCNRIGISVTVSCPYLNGIRDFLSVYHVVKVERQLAVHQRLGLLNCNKRENTMKMIQSWSWWEVEEILLTLLLLITTIVIASPSYWSTKSLLLGMEWLLKRQDLQMFSIKLNKKWVIFKHLRLWIAVARHNLKWLKI